jgi:hypothetical protein
MIKTISNYISKIQKLNFESMSLVHDISNRGFSQEVLNYEKTRPTYTNESLENIVQSFGLDDKSAGVNAKFNVLDLASGTGKFTKLNFILFYTQFKATFFS